VSRAACHDDRVRRIAPLLLLLAPALAACSGSADDDVAVPGAGTGSASAPAGPSDGSPDLAASAPAPLPTTVPPAPPPPPPETGVPGLDSPDAFCAAWSRYAGSFQVVAVASSFLIDEPQRAFELEVAAATTVTDAYAALAATWPAELETEREAALDTAFGPFAARAERARVLLARAIEDAGTGQEAVAAAWEAALATRDPDDPGLQVDLPGDAQAAVTAAAGGFAESEQPIYADPALVTDVATPLTDAYLLANCPDEGQLAGSDVEG
jgi:hypothetical protein